MCLCVIVELDQKKIMPVEEIYIEPGFVVGVCFCVCVWAYVCVRACVCVCVSVCK